MNNNEITKLIALWDEERKMLEIANRTRKIASGLLFSFSKPFSKAISEYINEHGVDDEVLKLIDAYAKLMDPIGKILLDWKQQKRTKNQ